MSRIFTATLDAVSSNKTKTVIKLSLGNKEAAVFAQRYLASIDKELHVSFEDPQMEMDIAPRQDGRPGMVATINDRGEVEGVKRDEGEEEGDLFPQDGAAELHDGTGDSEGESINPDPDDDSELDFPEEGEEVADSLSEDADPLLENDGEDPEVDREKLEEYILENQPTFEDIPFNFGILLSRRRQEKVTWMELANEVGTSSTRLQSFYTDYKKRVARKMKEDGVA